MIVLLMGYNVTTCSDITQQKYSARRPGAGLGLGWGWAEVGLGLGWSWAGVGLGLG